MQIAKQIRSISFELLYNYSSGFFLPLFICSEENVYTLCKKLCSDGIANSEGSDLFVVFISNEKKQACTNPSSRRRFV